MNTVSLNTGIWGIKELVKGITGELESSLNGARPSLADCKGYLI